VENALYVALSRQMALRRMLDVTANNVANMNTTGFRAERPVFDDFVTRARAAGPGQGMGTGTGNDATAFVVDRATYTDTWEGAVSMTGNPLDVAIRGDAWLQVETQDGPRFTRDGRLNRDADGRLVTLSGHPVLDADGAAITLPEDVATITIDAGGTISTRAVTGEGAVETVALGRIGLFRLPGAQALAREEGGLVRFDGTAPAADGAGLVQGGLESANVQPIMEMVRLIDLTRAYGQANRMVEAEHERQRSAIGKLGGPATS
jgi:flagellar basal-body rod protein FlgF